MKTINAMKERKLTQVRPVPKMLALSALILLGGALAAGLAQQAPTPSVGSGAHAHFQPSQPQHAQQLLQLERKYRTVSQRIATAQEKAAKNSAVKKKRLAYVNALYKKMAHSAPGMKTQIDQFRKLGKQLRGDAQLHKPAFERSKSFDQKLSKYQHLSAQLGPIVQQASSDPQVAKLRSAYVKGLLAQMRKTEPQINSLLQQRQQLAQSIHSLQSRQFALPSHASHAPQSPSRPSHNPPQAWSGQSTPHAK